MLLLTIVMTNCEIHIPKITILKKINIRYIPSKLTSFTPTTKSIALPTKIGLISVKLTLIIARRILKMTSPLYFFNSLNKSLIVSLFDILSILLFCL